MALVRLEPTNVFRVVPNTPWSFTQAIYHQPTLCNNIMRAHDCSHPQLVMLSKSGVWLPLRGLANPMGAALASGRYRIQYQGSHQRSTRHLRGRFWFRLSIILSVNKSTINPYRAPGTQASDRSWPSSIAPTGVMLRSSLKGEWYRNVAHHVLDRLDRPHRWGSIRLPPHIV